MAERCCFSPIKHNRRTLGAEQQAAARPIPDDAPVTIATLFTSNPLVASIVEGRRISMLVTLAVTRVMRDRRRSAANPSMTLSEIGRPAGRTYCGQMSSKTVRFRTK